MNFRLLRLFPKIVFLGFIFMLGCLEQSKIHGEKAGERENIPNRAQSEKGEIKMEENDRMEKKPTLETEINLQNDSMQINYRVKNKSDRAIYIFNVLWEWDAKGQYIRAPQAVYASLNGDGTLHLSQQIPPLPKSKRVEVRRIPYVTKIESGEELSEKINVAVPVEEYNPYFPKKDGSAVESKTAKSIIFSIEFISQTDDLKVTATNIENAFSVWHQDLLTKTETLSSKPKLIPVKVNKRTDLFEEF